MPAYLIADVSVRDQDAYAAYAAQVPATLEPYGGRFLVRGGASEVIEGDRRPGRLVVIEFPDGDALRGWYASGAYQAIAGVRWRAAEASVVAVEGAE